WSTLGCAVTVTWPSTVLVPDVPAPPHAAIIPSTASFRMRRTLSQQRRDVAGQWRLDGAAASLRMRERHARGVQRVAREHEQRRELGHQADVAVPDERVVAVRVQLVADDRESDRREVRADLVLPPGDQRAPHERVRGATPFDAL